MLTGARLGEVRTATFDQFNLELAIWTKQAAYTKQRRVHRIPISAEAVALSGRIPWRRMAREGEFTACYIGISFYREAGGQQLFTSAAQMFDERGRGFILNLPCTAGFFFGESDGSEKHDDLQFVAKAREALAAGLTVFYSSWW
jgi:hypothetical protein